MAASQPAARSRPYGAPRSHAGPQETNSDPYPATSHHGSSRHRGFTLSMILTSLIRATCSARGETRVEMTHKALPPTRALGAGLHQREDAVPELAKADRVSECPSLLGGLYPAVGSPEEWRLLDPAQNGCTEGPQLYYNANLIASPGRNEQKHGRCRPFQIKSEILMIGENSIRKARVSLYSLGCPGTQRRVPGFTSNFDGRNPRGFHVYRQSFLHFKCEETLNRIKYRESNESVRKIDIYKK
ncbi:uncharacterized protein LOC116091775 [Mastomys coucha]|uniref:uncharacterized protein LOC116091775 n=1 Tax=Mastomys coucha TaxID=35658 RepID=UPI0012621032|nr:uncharacterized protein LOC116091775 [Mastomys coucha]